MFLALLPFFLHLGLCAFVGRLGRRRSIGFAGFFTLSLVLTPLGAAILLLISAERRSDGT